LLLFPRCLRAHCRCLVESLEDRVFVVQEELTELVGNSECVRWHVVLFVLARGNWDFVRL
jgi:hypothetical protein